MLRTIFSLARVIIDFIFIFYIFFIDYGGINKTDNDLFGEDDFIHSFLYKWSFLIL